MKNFKKNLDHQSQFNTLINIPISYTHLNSGANKPLLVFFHGFADSARAFLKRAYPEPSLQYEILAINGPFPVPQQKDGIWKHAFAWYFSDFTTGTIYIHPRVAAQAVHDLLTELDLHSRKKILIGFSQGGFFIPHVLQLLKNVEHVIAIGATYRSEDYPSILTMSVDALHGVYDGVIPFEKAQKSFQDFKTKNPNGVFIQFENMGHTMNSEARAWLNFKINQVFDKSAQV